MKIAFVWQGISDQKIYDHWEDGLSEAIKILSFDHDVQLCEPWDDIKNVDVILYWEAPCTVQGKNAPHYKKVQANPIKKILLFAGGPLTVTGLAGFDLFLVESKINEEEFEKIGLPYRRAFGINDQIFKPLPETKKYDAVMQATFAGWKRQGLFAQALGKNGALCGRYQETDPNPYNDAKAQGCAIFGELMYSEVARLINQSHTVVNTSEFWGGGQRCTLEAMACGIPPIVMSDSPKNMEYVQESGFGLIVDPSPERIAEAVDYLKNHPQEAQKGIDYIAQNWTAQIYAENILNAIQSL